jgi:hypothetical protein
MEVQSGEVSLHGFERRTFRPFFIFLLNEYWGQGILLDNSLKTDRILKI